MASKKILFIINKHAGTHYESKLEGRIIDSCEKHDTECGIEFTQSKGHATELSREAASHGYDRVIAVGGDGTVNEAAHGLLNSDMPLGILPKGSGNGLARHLGMPMNIPQAVEALFDCTAVRMDTFYINSHLAVNVAGLGFDGLVANLFDNNGQRGLAGYVKVTLKEFFNFKNFNARVQMNGTVIDKPSFIIAVANSSQYGNNARIAPAASVQDKLLQISFIQKVPYLRIPGFAWSFFAGTIDRHKRYYQSLTASEVTIETANATPFHVDGEPCGSANKFTVKVNPASLNILVPRARAGTV